jgi:[ribosomal protein S5]-alanine N-acetyltransferase
MPVPSSTFPGLVTERLLLRQLTPDDAKDIFLLRSDDIVNKYLDRSRATTLEDAQQFIGRINSAIYNQQSLFWAICLRGSEKLIGTICLWNFSPGKDKAEVGYELLPGYHGKGIMHEALSMVLEFGLQILELTTIEAWTVQQNIPSIRLLERNGFERDLSLENKIDRATEGPDLVIYSRSGKAV